jgi:hypothetical protein
MSLSILVNYKTSINIIMTPQQVLWETLIMQIDQTTKDQQTAYQ